MSDRLPQPPSASPRIIDVEFGISRFRLQLVIVSSLIGVLFLVALAVLLAAIANYLPSNPALAGTVLAPPIAGLLWLGVLQFRRLTREKVRRLVEAWEPDDPAANVTDEGPCRVITTQTALVELGRTLVRRGRLGLVIRSVPYPDRQSPEPLSMPFQPVPLNCRDPRFADVESQGRGRRVGRKLLWRSWRHRKCVLLRNAMFCVMLIHFGWAFLVEAARTLTTGNVSLRLGWAVAILGCFILGLVVLPRWRGSRWILVPGGLVRRLPGRKYRSRLHVFNPASSLLIVTNQIDQWWHAYIWDETTYGSIQMNRNEAELLLRNWISNMPPPKAEELSDLE